MRTLILTFLVCVLVSAAAVLAEENQPRAGNPFSDHNRLIYGGVQGIVLGAAEKMPEENYGFKPADSVRTFGQIVGHIADSQYRFCAVALGETAPGLQIEQTKTSKADLIAALKEAFAYCRRASDPMTDAAGSEMVKFMRTDMPKLGVLTVNNVHSTEHYGNLVTYLRLKNVVPPTSDPEFMQRMMKR
jgi:uncharacterized damage-inducible protein DinB